MRFTTPGLLRWLLLLTTAGAALLPEGRPSVGISHAAGEDTMTGKVRWAYYVPYAANSLESLRRNVVHLTHLSPYWYQIDEEGNLISTGSQEVAERNREEVLRLARGNRVRVLPMIKNSATYAAFHPVLAEAELRKRAIDRIVGMTVEGGFEGAHIDFEGLDGADRPHLTTFMAELAAALRAAGKMVTQAVPAKDVERTTGWAGAYDYAALAPSNDLVVIMTYGYGTAVPQSTAPYPWVQRSTAFAASQIPPAKLLLGLAWYGYDWNRTAGSVTALRHVEALTRAQTYTAALRFDDATKTPTFTYTADEQEHEVWFEDARSNDAKMDLVFQYGLAGAAGWRMGHEDPAVWPLYRDRLGFRTWYLAEGSTANPYHTWLLIQNPNSFPVDVDVTFLRENGGAPPVQKYTLRPNSRFSLFVNRVVPDAAFSTKVEATASIIVERAMYFGYGGHDSVGANAPSRRWYLPQGAAGEGAHTWLLLMNPNPEATPVRLSFLRPDGSTIRRDFTVKGMARLNVFANQYLADSAFATVVEADLPVVAERASYYDGGKAGHGARGASFTARRWHMAEGFTGHTVTIAVVNPNPVAAQATVTFMLENGRTVQRAVTLRPTSRLTILANDYLPPDTPFSTLLEADQPVAVERTSLIPNGNGHSAPGVAAPARTWFLAEGSTAAPFKTYVLLQNPSGVAARARVTFMTESGRNVAQELDLLPRSRATIDASQVAPNVAFSVRVDSDQPIVVERAMYFGRGSHASAGVGQ
ncbi:MAG: hypothetical protein HYY02_03555 [Chloroflexi bacterium]|nr:hypothetical protein [Chloroflexota bacterium]